MSATTPVVMFAFANDSDEHLASLKAESRDLYRVLQSLADQEKIAIHREESTDLNELYQDLLAFDGRLCIFHYGGHSDGTSLQLEGGSGGASGLAKLLGRQPQLKLVFLNGCANKNQVTALHDAGVPAVIATAVKINDARATEFSGAYYRALASGDSLFTAFERASAFLEAQHGEAAPAMRGGMLSGFDDEVPNDEQDTAEFEWGLYVAPAHQKDLEGWRLADARERARLQLRDDSGAIKDVDGKFLSLERIEKIRSGRYMLCSNCGAQTSVVSEEAPYKCPVCASTKISSLDGASPQADKILPASLSRKEAEQIACDKLECSAEELESLELVYVPYWVFTGETRTQFSGERGDVVDFDADKLEPKWESVKGKIDQSISEFGVPAYQGNTQPHLLNDEWDWSFADLKMAAEHQPTVPQLSIATNAQAAFTILSKALTTECEDQAYSRIGGQQQKNIAIDTSYRNLELNTVQLPHWFAIANSNDGQSALAINAQNGATAIPSIPNTLNSQGVVEKTMKQKIENAQASKSATGKWASLFAGVGIGLMVGLLMGLAAPAPPAKTVVSIFIGAVGVVLAALLGLNDRNFSTAKSLRIGGFGLAVVFSALSGMYIREHGLVGRSLEERVSEYKEVFPDLTPRQIRQALAAEDRLFFTGTAATNNKPVVLERIAADSNGAGSQRTTAVAVSDAENFSGINLRDGMYSQESVDTTICGDLQNIDGGVSSPELTIFDFENMGYDFATGWHKMISDSKQFSTDESRASFLLLVRDAKCGSANNGVVSSDSESCAVLRSNTGSVDSLMQSFDEQSEMASVLSGVDQKFGADEIAMAFQLFSDAVCTETGEEEP